MKIRIEWVPEGTTGEGTLTAFHSDTVVHADKGNIKTAAFRDAFMTGLCEGRKGIDADQVREELLRLAAAEIRQLEEMALKKTPPCQNILAYQPFPVESLPQPVQQFVTDGAAAIGCDSCYIALPLLAAAAAAIGNTRRIRLKSSWAEPAVIWTVIIGDSGTLKSPACELALKVTRQRQAEAHRQYLEEREKHQRAMQAYEAQLSDWKRKGRVEGEKQPEKPKAPVFQRFVCSDITVEALAERLAETPRGLLMARDELAGWLASFDAYKQGRGSDAANWLEIHRAGPIIVDRKTGEHLTIHVPRAAVSVTGSIQPETLRRCLGRQYFENGLAARLLPAMPPRRRKRWTEATINAALDLRMERVFQKLFGLEFTTGPDKGLVPVDLELTSKARQRWVEFYDEHAREQEGMTGDLVAAWSKLEGYAARLALVVHLLRWAAKDPDLKDPNKVDSTSIKSGIALSRWFGHEARRVYAILGESESDRKRRHLIELIQARGGKATARELRHACKGSGEAERMLEDLVSAGLGCWHDRKSSRNGGRPTRVFHLRETTKTETPENR